MSDSCLSRDFSERLSFEMFRVVSADYPQVCATIATAFSLTPECASFGTGLDVVFMDYRRYEQLVELAWDNWSGFIVTAKSTDSEPLVREIASWLQCSQWALRTTEFTPVGDSHRNELGGSTCS